VKTNKIKLIYSLCLILLMLMSAGNVGADTSYVIQPGDTLYAISLRFGVSIQSIAVANSLVNPDLIYAGQTLIIPVGETSESPMSDPAVPAAPQSASTSGGGTYVIQPGDTLLRIAARFGVTVNSIIQVNNLANPNLIYAGQTLIIPGLPGSVGQGETPPEPPPPGQNLLPNASFEEGFYSQNGSPELQVPNGWQMEFDQGIPAPVTGITILRPESRLVPRWGLPEFEHPLFIWSGDWTVKVFKAHAPTNFRLFTDVHLEPGTYRFAGSYRRLRT
jgi:LysM repeat protein